MTQMLFQEPKSDKDEDNCSKVNEYLNHPPTPGSSRGGTTYGGIGGGGLPADLAAGLGGQSVLLICLNFFGLCPIWTRHIKFSFPVLCFFSMYSCLLHVFSYDIAPRPPPQFWSIQSFRVHSLLITMHSVFPSTQPNHCHLACLI